MPTVYAGSTGLYHDNTHYSMKYQLFTQLKQLTGTIQFKWHQNESSAYDAHIGNNSIFNMNFKTKTQKCRKYMMVVHSSFTELVEWYENVVNS